MVDYLTREMGSPRPTRGGISNAFYLRPFFKYLYTPRVGVIASLLWARPDEVDGIIAGENSRLGIEFDAGVELKLTRKASAGLELGYLLTGEGLSQDFDNPFALRGKFQIEF